MSTTTKNPWEEAEAWETGLDELLPRGNHVTVIEKADGHNKDGELLTSSNGKPQVFLRFKNNEGARSRYETYGTNGTDPMFLRKIVALCDAAGVQRPGEGDYDPETFRLSDEYIARLQGKTVGILVREEDDKRPDHVGEKQLVVAGYCEPSRITGGADTRGLPAGNGSGGSSADDDIPF